MGVIINGWSGTARPAPTFRRVLVSGPSPILSVQDAKAHLRITTPYEDAEVARWIRSATQGVEKDTGQALSTQTLDLITDDFPSGTVVRLPVEPIQSVTFIKYIDTAAVLQTWASSNYLVGGAVVSLADGSAWPTDARTFDGITVRVVAGYALVSQIPEGLIDMVRLRLLWQYRKEAPSDQELRLYETWQANYRTTLVA